MARKEKLGTLRGVGEWKQLESAGDVRRFLAWCIHSVREQSLEPKTAAILGQLGSFILKAVETSDIEARLEALEKHRASQQGAQR
jgi:hypothetical protein